MSINFNIYICSEFSESLLCGFTPPAEEYLWPRGAGAVCVCERVCVGVRRASSPGVTHTSLLPLLRIIVSLTVVIIQLSFEIVHIYSVQFN
jgi:hypothetical protein